MGKFLIVSLASLFVLGFVVALAPATQSHAFFMGTFSVRWIYLIGVGCLFGGYKLLGK